MFCSKCNNELKPGELFCGKCGTKVENPINSTQNDNIQEMTNDNISKQASSNSSMETLNNGINDKQINQQQVQNVNLMNEQSAVNNISNYQQTSNGQQLNQENQPTNNTFNSQTYYSPNQKKENSWKNITSIVIGIVSLIVVFIFQIFTMPLSIVGIVFGVLSLKENKKHKIGLILNIISFSIAIPILILYSIIFGILPNNPTTGTWNCKTFNSGYNEDLDYIITMKLNNDNQFKWSKYNDENNNYVIGTYKFEDLHKTNYGGTTNYYSIKLTGNEFVKDGILQTEKYKSEYEIGIMKDTDEAILMNTYTHNMYYCYRSDTSSPKVESNYSKTKK